MADFVAVIRRAVDGLSDNTPELRAKVYDKARSAVLRQLESMKPRPPEEMLRRQLDKLEAAILDVEAEHAEAFPPEEEAELIEAETLPMETGAGPAPDEEDPVSAAPDMPEVPEPEAAPAAEPHPIEPHSPEPHAVEPQPVAAAAPAREPEVASRPVVTQNYLYGDESWAGEDEEAVPEAAELRPYPAPAPVSPAVSLPVAVPLAVPVAAPEEPEPVWATPPRAEPETTAVETAEDETVAETVEPSEPVEMAYEEVRHDMGEPAGHAHHDLVEAVPERQEPEPVYHQDAARDEAAIYAYQEEETYPDFPVEEPTEKYSHPFVETPASPPLTAASPEHWPEGGVESPVTATLEAAEWTAPARFEPETDAPPQTEVAGMRFADQAELEPQDPFGWTPPAPEPAPAFVHEEPAYLPEEVHAEPVLSAEDELRAFGYEKPAPAPMEEFVPVPESVLPKPLAAERPQPVAQEPVHEPVHEPVMQDDALLAGRSDSSWDESPFVDVPLPGDADNGAARGPETVRAESQQEQRGWDEFEEYANYDASKPETEQQEDDYIFTPVEKPTRSYRIEQRRRYDFTSLGLGLLGLLLVAGSGYGAWVFRDTLSGLVTGLVSSPPSQETKATTTPASTTPATDAASGGTPATATPSTPQTSASTPVPSDLAATQAESDIQKFTQRLQADGSEVDEGKADGAASGEGTSVAPQTVASNDPVDTTLPATTPTTPANTSAAAIPAGAAQKMYLYEERLGQTSPVAVEGSVVWTLKHEAADNGKSEAIVQGQVTAPDRGLSALITFKRNLDPSLPASHLVELVFSLPKDFDGGAIASVQRVALKENEQDRGDPLVAVPAKITDDFHMIALNDYPDARAFNLRLLQTRNWIDIPLTYRNGRRALLTMDKGAAGAQAFNQAISEWQAEEAAAAPTPASQPSAPSGPAATQGQQAAPAPANP